MIRVSEVIGSYSSDKLLSGGYSVDFLRLEQWESSKSRLRKKTDNGLEMAISLERGSHLHNNDILHLDEASKTAIVVHIHLENVMRITLPANIEPATLFKLGHALGNQHWPSLLKDNCVYVPLYVDSRIMKSMIKTHNFGDLSLEFIDGKEVLNIFDSKEARLLFSGSDHSVHSHS